MATEINPFITQVSWNEVREKVYALNPEFTESIDRINPPKSSHLYIVKYRYGEFILKNSIFYIPNHLGKVVPIDDDSVPASLSHDLAYNERSNPVSITLNNSFELFANHNHQCIPFSMGVPGTILGTWLILTALGDQHAKALHSFHPIFIWQMTAGCRSVFMLPKISEATGHNNLKLKYQRKD